MPRINIPEVFCLSFENLNVDINSRSDLSADVSLIFIFPNGQSTFEEIQLWFDMVEWREWLTKLKSGAYDGIEIHDLSRKFTISFFSTGLQIKVKISINRAILSRGYARADYEVKTETDTINRFSSFMFTILDEYNLIV